MINAEGEAMYGTADIDADEGAGRFKMKAHVGDAKGALVTYFVRREGVSSDLGGTRFVVRSNLDGRDM